MVSFVDMFHCTHGSESIQGRIRGRRGGYRGQLTPPHLSTRRLCHSELTTTCVVLHIASDNIMKRSSSFSVNATMRDCKGTLLVGTDACFVDSEISLHKYTVDSF